MNGDSQSISEYMQVLHSELLRQHCQNCEKELKFDEAETTKRKIAQLQLQEESRREQELKVQQENERSELDDSHLLEFQEFSAAWEQRKEAQKTYIEEQIEALTLAQKEEKLQFIDKIEKSTPRAPKPSGELLNLRKIQESLVKQKCYQQASGVKSKIRQLEIAEQNRWEGERVKKINQQIGHLEERQVVRMNALKKKLKAMEDELEKVRVTQLERLLQKYHNIKKGLQNYQITQFNTLHKIQMDAFDKEELENLKQIFDSFDKQNLGVISISDLQEILSSLGKSPDQSKLYIVSQLLGDVHLQTAGQFTLQEFLVLVSNIEEQPEEAPQELQSPNNKILDFLRQFSVRLLEDYRKQCEEQDRYAQARKAKAKYDQLRKKETLRQLNQIKVIQQEELDKLEEAQRQQFIEFSNAWDNYMSDYEGTAYTSLEKLKEKHMIEYQEFHQKALKEAKAKVKFSKQVLALRDKQKTLAKQKLYAEAERTQEKADQLMEWERNRNEQIIQDIVSKKEKKLKKEQQLALAALLKRIQRDRNEQLKHRQQDSERLIQRNKNMRNDIIMRQNGEAKRTIEEIKRNFGLHSFDIKYEPKKGTYKLEKARASTTRFDER